MGRRSTVEKYIGKRVGGITILEKTDLFIKGKLLVKCQCSVCNRYFHSQFHNVYRGNYKSCGCIQHGLQKDNPKWRGFGEISQSYLGSLKRGAKARDLSFKLTIEELWQLFVSQGHKCAFTGISLTFNRARGSSKQTASLDRIDAKKGYVAGNVQWIHKDLNFMKQNMDNEEFLKWIDVIYKYNNYIV